MPDVDAAVDRLYQLPLDEFTPARNALAKELKRPTIKDLEKPNVAAWAVNQLYWHERATWDRLLKAGERLRAEHRKLLAGKASDIRDPEKAHRDAVRDAVEAVKKLLTGGGQATSPATLTAVQETLEALPAPDPPGRLTRPLKPMGFEALSGVTVRPGLRIVPRPEKPAPDNATAAKAPTAKDKQREREAAKAREKEERERTERRREAEKALKTAEAAMLRAEDAVKKAEKALGDLREKRDEAVSEYQRARLRVHE
jgi:phage-related minor tail protein